MRKVAESRNRSKQMRFEEGEKVTTGIDTHKGSYHVAVYSWMRKGIVYEWTMPANDQALINRLACHRDNIECIFYEAGPKGFGLARALMESDLPVQVIAPSKTPQEPGVSNKTDRIDARKLAEFGAKDMLHEIYIPTPEQEEDRTVQRTRNTSLKELKRAKQRIKSFLLFHSIEEPEGLANWSNASVKKLREMKLCATYRYGLNILLEDFEHFTAQLQRTTTAVNALLKSDRYEAQEKILRTHPAVGPLTAATFLLEMPNPERFENRGNISGITGLAPQIRQSADVSHKGPIKKTGNTRLRTALVEAAWRWIGKEEAARRRFNAYLSNSGEANKAIVAMARKLAIILWRMLVDKKPYAGLSSPKARPSAARSKKKAAQSKRKRSA